MKNTTQLIAKFLNRNVKPTEIENTFTPRPFVCVRQSVDAGAGLSFNDKAKHIHSQIKAL